MEVIVIVVRISEKLGDLLCKEHIIRSDEKDFYEYGLQITLANLINFLIVLLIGILFHSIPEMALFYSVFVSLRFYCGGYHADSYANCFITFSLTSSLCLAAAKRIFVYETVQKISFLFAVLFLGITILKKAPVGHANRPFSTEEKKLFKRRSVQVYSFWFMIGMILWKTGQTDLTACLISTFIIVSVLMLVKGGKQDEEKRTSAIGEGCRECSKEG